MAAVGRKKPEGQREVFRRRELGVRQRESGESRRLRWIRKKKGKMEKEGG